jgi:hypothetical protein
MKELSPEARPHPRQHTRFAVNVAVRCARVAGRKVGVWRGRTANISRGGLAIELSNRLPPATKVVIEIRTGIGPMRTEADVVWTKRLANRPETVRHGLCFANRSELLDLPIGVLLGQWLQRRARSESRSTMAHQR